jgi:hypothetical protein
MRVLDRAPSQHRDGVSAAMSQCRVPRMRAVPCTRSSAPTSLWLTGVIPRPSLSTMGMAVSPRFTIVRNAVSTVSSSPTVTTGLRHDARVSERTLAKTACGGDANGGDSARPSLRAATAANLILLDEPCDARLCDDLHDGARPLFRGVHDGDAVQRLGCREHLEHLEQVVVGVNLQRAPRTLNSRVSCKPQNSARRVRVQTGSTPPASQGPTSATETTATASPAACAHPRWRPQHRRCALHGNGPCTTR